MRAVSQSGNGNLQLMRSQIFTIDIQIEVLPRICQCAVCHIVKAKE